jgi:hypothetical protein
VAQHLTTKNWSPRELPAQRSGILGVMIVLAGMILAWPNPASIVPAALLNFAIFTALAIALELPGAHLIAAICFALAYLVTFHVVVGQHHLAKPACDVVARRESFSLAVDRLVGAFALFCRIVRNGYHGAREKPMTVTTT